MALMKLINDDEIHLTSEERTEMKTFLIKNDDDNDDMTIIIIRNRHWKIVVLVVV